MWWGPVRWGWLSQTRPIPRSPDGDNKNEKYYIFLGGGVWEGGDFMRKKPLCEKCCDKNYSKSPAEINELVAMVGGGGASHIHCVSL